MEIDRSSRYQHSFSVVYLDLDNFKQVNDQFGHQVGDEALFMVAQFLKRNLRKIDVVARLGGDEFALLFPETDQSSVQEILTKVNTGLLWEMKQKQWPITFSMGAITIICVDDKTSVDNIIQQADTLMYGVKKQNKNDIRFELYKRY
jgi:diguanylate cyclase (GGDEF)-like protein